MLCLSRFGLLLLQQFRKLSLSTACVLHQCQDFLVGLQLRFKLLVVFFFLLELDAQLGDAVTAVVFLVDDVGGAS